MKEGRRQIDTFIIERIDSIDKKLDSILIQTTKTNGRVSRTIKGATNAPTNNNWVSLNFSLL